MSLTSAETGPASFKAALGSLAASVNVITLWDAGGRPLGMTATAFSSVSVDPLLVLVCINRATRTYDQVSAGERFGVNILGTDAREISDYCGRPGGDKVLEAGWLAGGGAGTGADVGVGGGDWNSPALSGALAFLDCRVDQEVQAGTHAVIIGAVEGIGLPEPPGPGPHSQPLLHFRGRYRQLDRVRQAAAPRPLPIALEELA
jgi:flavin reductase (DIM6/NTAB) family NADH-FMN oxidoreductase RutF